MRKKITLDAVGKPFAFNSVQERLLDKVGRFRKLLAPRQRQTVHRLQLQHPEL